MAGLVVEVEHRSLQVLACLLLHADEVVTRQELFDVVWGDRPTVDNVLANAVAKLRKALGASEAARIVNVPRVGYRLQGPVARAASGRRLFSRLDLASSQPVPGREHFVLLRQLGPAQGSEVWLARHAKTGEQQVYKFSTDGEGLAALKREATLYRVLHDTLGERDDVIRVFDWNFEQSPFLSGMRIRRLQPGRLGGGATRAGRAVDGTAGRSLPEDRRCGCRRARCRRAAQGPQAGQCADQPGRHAGKCAWRTLAADACSIPSSLIGWPLRPWV